MTYLLDTHLLLWFSEGSPRLSGRASYMLEDRSNTFAFSASSIWELTIKATKRPDIFRVDTAFLRDSLVGIGFQEIPVRSTHAVAVGHLPRWHDDPFDRILIAQAIAENIVLATVDADILRYSAPIRDVS